MKEHVKQQIEKFEEDYNKLFSKGVWSKDEIAMMKDLKKLIYYNKVICAMDEGEGYPGEKYVDEYDRSYAHGGRMRNPNTGRYMSRGSGMYDPWYYDDMRGSGRRYYDGKKESIVHELHRMMDMEENPQKRMAIQEVIHEFEDM